MEDVRLYYSNMCSESKKLLDFIEEEKIPMDGIKMMDATKDMKLQVDIYKLGGKSQVPMLYIDGDVIYGCKEIQDYLKRV